MTPSTTSVLDKKRKQLEQFDITTIVTAQGLKFYINIDLRKKLYKYQKITFY